MEKQDTSKRLVVILLIVTILVSILGTWTIISAINAVTVYDKAASITGKVAVTIVNDKPIEESTIKEDDHK